MDETRRDRLKELEDAWKQWAGRAPETPPKIAARRVLARLPEKDPDRRGLSLLLQKSFLLPAVAVVVLALAVGVTTRFQEAPVDVRAGHPSPSIELNDNVALIWLDSETPLYLTLAAPEPAQGETR